MPQQLPGLVTNAIFQGAPPATRFTGPASAPGWFQSTIPSRGEMAAAAAGGNVGVGGAAYGTAPGYMGTPPLFGGPLGRGNAGSLRAAAGARAAEERRQRYYTRLYGLRQEAAKAGDADAEAGIALEMERIGAGGSP
jgi:hypothetical protein